VIAFWRDVGSCAFFHGKLSDPIRVEATVGEQLTVDILLAK
jgi:hypothetical protein